MRPFSVDKCEPNIEWEILRAENIGAVDMPSETSAVKRTYIFTMSYLALHVALIVVSTIAFCGIALSGVGRKSFSVLIAPWIILLITIIVCDALATIYYIIDTVTVSVSIKNK
jgi:hypothetical protein